MPNISVANVVAVTPAKSQSCDVAKVSSKKNTTSVEQNDLNYVSENEDSSVIAENPNITVDSQDKQNTKDKQASDFKSILEKQLSGDSASEDTQQADTQNGEQYLSDTITQTVQIAAPLIETVNSQIEEMMPTEGVQTSFSMNLFDWQTWQLSDVAVSEASQFTAESNVAATSFQQIPQMKVIQSAASVAAQATAAKQDSVQIMNPAEKTMSGSFDAITAESFKKVATDTVQEPVAITGQASELATSPATTSPATTNAVDSVVLDVSQSQNSDEEGASAVLNAALKQQTAAPTQIQGRSKTTSVSQQAATAITGNTVDLEQQAKSVSQQTKDTSSMFHIMPVESIHQTVHSDVSTHSDTDLLTQSVSSTAGTEKTSSVQQVFLKPSEQIIEQIQSSITGTSQQIRVTLSPEELGTVRITFRQENGHMEGLVEVQSAEVRKDIEKALPQIATTLAESGIQIRRIEVAPMSNQQQNQQAGQEAFQSPGQDLSSADQYYMAGQSRSSFSRSGGAGTEASSFAEQTSAEQMRQSFGQSSLGMYA